MWSQIILFIFGIFFQLKSYFNIVPQKQILLLFLTDFYYILKLYASDLPRHYKQEKTLRSQPTACVLLTLALNLDRFHFTTLRNWSIFRRTRSTSGEFSYPLPPHLDFCTHCNRCLGNGVKPLHKNPILAISFLFFFSP